MKAIILAAGFVTLDPLAKDRPRSLILINEKPIIEHILEKLKLIKSIKKIYIITNDKFKPLFDAWINDYNSEKVEVLSNGVSIPEDLFGPVRDLYHTINTKKLRDDLLVIAGDNLFDFSLDNFVKNTDKIKIGVYDIKSPDLAKNYGVVKLKENKVINFKEKPRNPKTTTISTAIYLFPISVMPLLNEFLDTDKESLGDFIKYLITQKEVYAHNFDGHWFDIDSFESLARARDSYK